MGVLRAWCSIALALLLDTGQCTGPTLAPPSNSVKIPELKFEEAQDCEGSAFWDQS